MGQPHLLYIINVDWYFQSHWLQRAQAAQQAGFRVTIIAHFSRPELKQNYQDGGMHCVDLAITRSGLNPLQELRTVVTLYRLVRALKPDLIQTVTIKPNIYGGLIAWRLKCPLVAAITGLGIVFSSTKLKHRMVRYWIEKGYRRIFARPHCKVLFQHAEDRDRFIEDGVIAADQAVIIAGSGVDMNDFSYSPELNNDPPVILFAARLLRDKGLHLLVEAVQQLAARNVAVKLMVAGILDPTAQHPVAEQQLIEWQEAGLIEWLGQRDDIAQLIAQSNIVALPTYYGEGIPRIMIEAAASGRAAVISDLPGCRDVVLDGVSGLLVPIHDVAALADALQRLIEDQPLRHQMGRNARAHAEATFSLERVVNETVAVYRSLDRDE